MKKELTRQQQKRIYLGAILIFVVLMILVFYYVGRPLVRFANEPQKFAEWIDSFGIWSRLIYVLLTVLQVLVAIIPGEPFEIGGGYAFGLWEGTLLCLIGITIGCILIFVFVRKYGQGLVEVFFEKEKIDKLKFLHDKRKLNSIAFMVFMIPGTPKDLLSYVMGLTEMDLKTWIFITFFARIPSVFSSTYLGTALGQGNLRKSAFIFVITALISGLGLVIYNIYVKRKNGE